MRINSILGVVILSGALALGCAPARAAKPDLESSRTQSLSLRGCWRVDHYVYDAALHRSWAVLFDCDHPNEPSRMVLLPGSAKFPKLRTIADGRTGSRPEGATDWKESNRTEPAAQAQTEVRTGERVVVASGSASPAAFALPGTAEETASVGHTIRVRLKVNGTIVHAVVCGPHRVELVAGSKPAWR